VLVTQYVQPSRSLQPMIVAVTLGVAVASGEIARGTSATVAALPTRSRIMPSHDFTLDVDAKDPRSVSRATGSGSLLAPPEWSASVAASSEPGRHGDQRRFSRELTARTAC